jgi:hypothetical protein
LPPATSVKIETSSNMRLSPVRSNSLATGYSAQVGSRRTMSPVRYSSPVRARSVSPVRPPVARVSSVPG